MATSSARNGAHSACQAPAARSCSCSMQASRVATSPGACLAHARADTAATGLRLCGIEDEPPGAVSRTSPTSVWASRTTSPAALAIAPQAVPSPAASSAIRERSVCHGSTGASRPSSAA